MASAPTARRFSVIGTQMKLSSCCAQLGAPRRAMQERRLAADARHDDRLAALHDAAGDAFADAVADRRAPVAEAVGRLDAQLAVLVQQRHDAADGAVMARQDLEDAVQRRLQVERARQRLAHLEQRRQPPRFAGRRVHVCRGCFGASRRHRPGHTLMSRHLNRVTFLSRFTRAPSPWQSGRSDINVVAIKTSYVNV